VYKKIKTGLQLEKYNEKVLNMLLINNLIKINKYKIHSKKKMYHVYFFKKTHHKQNLLCVCKK